MNEVREMLGDLRIGRLADERAKQSTSAANYATDTLNGQRDAMALAEKQLSLLTSSADKRALMVALLQKEQDLTAHLIPLDSDQAKAILAAVTAQTQFDERLKASEDSINAMRPAGDKLIDDLFNPKGDGMESLLRDAKEELEKMALINLLKNLLGGEKLPTLGGAIGSAWGGGGIGDILSFLLHPPHFAAGTDYSSAGPAWVGENGPELVNLPRGAQITNASDTRRVMAAGGGGGAQHFHFDFKGVSSLRT